MAVRMGRLLDLVSAELAEPVDARVADMAAALARLYPEAARAVLFYGSCLRQCELDGLMLDFYLIVSDYRDAYRSRWLMVANAAIPPNVFPFEHQGLVAKYAVLSEADFARECGMDARSTSVWARFAQPARLVWAYDQAAGERTVLSVASAPSTLFARTRPVTDSDDPVEIFRDGFALTYGAELRAERAGRPGAVVEADEAYFRAIGETVLSEHSHVAVHDAADARRWWRRQQVKGKALTLLRLAKASLTYAGGVDYLAWKINRHAGTRIEIRPWQRRWPILGALVMLPRLIRSGAIR